MPADTAAIRRAVLRLALPIVGSNLLQRGVGVVDTVMVGRLGAEELAAVGLAQLLIFFQMALVYGLGVGLTVMVAYHTGAGDAVRRARTVRSGLALGLGLAVGLSLLGLWGSPWAAALLGASGRVLELSVAYLLVSWILFVFLVFLLAVGLKSGNVKSAPEACMRQSGEYPKRRAANTPNRSQSTANLREGGRDLRRPRSSHPPSRRPGEKFAPISRACPNHGQRRFTSERSLTATSASHFDHANAGGLIHLFVRIGGARVCCGAMGPAGGTWRSALTL